MIVSTNGKKLKQCSMKNGQLAKKLKSRELTENMVILQAYFCTLQKGKQAKTVQHRITNSWVFHSIETVATIISEEHSDHYLEQYSLKNYLHFYNHLTYTEYKPA